MVVFNYVIARSDRFCRAVPIPRKGSARYQLFVAVVSRVVTGLQFLNVITYKIPPQRRFPDHPPLMVKGALLVAKAIRYLTKVFCINNGTDIKSLRPRGEGVTK